MDVYEKIQNLLSKKEKEELNDSDRKKCEFIHFLLEKKERFFSINKKAISGILIFLGVTNEKEMIDMYNEIVSIENFVKYVPKQRNIINS